jgi:hypothetical protein
LRHQSSNAQIPKAAINRVAVLAKPACSIESDINFGVNLSYLVVPKWTIDWFATVAYNAPVT